MTEGNVISMDEILERHDADPIEGCIALEELAKVTLAFDSKEAKDAFLIAACDGWGEACGYHLEWGDGPLEEARRVHITIGDPIIPEGDPEDDADDWTFDDSGLVE